jgi:hypothetical protein
VDQYGRVRPHPCWTAGPGGFADAGPGARPTRFIRTFLSFTAKEHQHAPTRVRYARRRHHPGRRPHGRARFRRRGAAAGRGGTVPVRVRVHLSGHLGERRPGQVLPLRVVQPQQRVRQPARRQQPDGRGRAAALLGVRRAELRRPPGARELRGQPVADQLHPPGAEGAPAGRAGGEPARPGPTRCPDGPAPVRSRFAFLLPCTFHRIGIGVFPDQGDDQRARSGRRRRAGWR